MELMGGIERAKDVINGVKQDASRHAATASVPLNQVAKIVNINISVAEGEGKGLGTRDTNSRERRWHTDVSREGTGRVLVVRRDPSGRGL
jgi:hypothetical protein